MTIKPFDLSDEDIGFFKEHGDGNVPDGGSGFILDFDGAGYLFACRGDDGQRRWYCRSIWGRHWDVASGFKHNLIAALFRCHETAQTLAEGVDFWDWIMRESDGVAGLYQHAAFMPWGKLRDDRSLEKHEAAMKRAVEAGLIEEEKQ